MIQFFWRRRFLKAVALSDILCQVLAIEGKCAVEVAGDFGRDGVRWMIGGNGTPDRIMSDVLLLR